MYWNIFLGKLKNFEENIFSIQKFWIFWKIPSSSVNITENFQKSTKFWSFSIFVPKKFQETIFYFKMFPFFPDFSKIFLVTLKFNLIFLIFNHQISIIKLFFSLALKRNRKKGSILRLRAYNRYSWRWIENRPKAQDNPSFISSLNRRNY